MMNKFNYQSNQFIESSELPRLSICACSPNDKERRDEVPIKQLAGGSIDYAFYDKEARAARSGAFHGYLTKIIKAVRGGGR